MTRTETTYTIKKINETWYDFSTLNQESRYIKINALNCGTDRKAINTARKIIGDKKAVVIIN